MPKKLLMLSPLLFCLLFAIFVPLLSPYAAGFNELANAKMPPNLEHFFGTDLLGRDLFTQLAQGLRVSLFVGFVAAFMSVGLFCWREVFFIAFLYEVWSRF